MITSIERKVIWDYQDVGAAYFHPRACVVPENGRETLFMTLQKVTGSDVFHNVKWSVSDDSGQTWTEPENIPELGWKPFVEDTFEGVCDVVPNYHKQTDTILAVGHNVFYQNDHLLDTMGSWNKDNIGYKQGFQRNPVYSIRKADGTWLTRKKLTYPAFESCNMYTCGCGEKVLKDDGNILIPTSFGSAENPARKVCSLECSYDGTDLTILSKGNDFVLDQRRGLLEPSMVEFDNRYFITIRAEDSNGYMAVSDDGLNWHPMKAWCWDDGEALDMSTTQQHWLRHDGCLYLVYNRKSACNTKVMRWRTPLYIAQVDTTDMCLIRDTEQVVFPILGDGNAEPARCPLMGNFHTTWINDQLSLVTVGENRHYDNWSGDTLIAWIK